MAKELEFIGSSQQDIRDFPERVRYDMGHAIWQIQEGKMPACAKPWKGLGSGIVEVLDDFDGNAYRAVCTLRFKEIIYVLHCFQKKSKSRIETPPRDKELVEKRLEVAKQHYKATYWK